MVGLLQIMIYLFCIYLVYKGVEIFQVAFVSNAGSKTKAAGMVIGALSIVGAVVVDGVAIYFTEDVISRIGNTMNNLPR